MGKGYNHHDYMDSALAPIEAQRDDALEELAKVEAERDELLAALKQVEEAANGRGHGDGFAGCIDIWGICRDAIAKAKG
tara:strand:- start:4213 stop:4449 length:237 start_codon:yes stop_codon:yes gene_type:complete